MAIFTLDGGEVVDTDGGDWIVLASSPVRSTLVESERPTKESYRRERIQVLRHADNRVLAVGWIEYPERQATVEHRVIQSPSREEVVRAMESIARSLEVSKYVWEEFLRSLENADM